MTSAPLLRNLVLAAPLERMIPPVLLSLKIPYILSLLKVGLEGLKIEGDTCYTGFGAS